MQQFENPLTETKHSLMRQYKEYMKQNKDILVIDLGENVPIYSHYINSNKSIEHWLAKSYLNGHLINITNAYRQNDVGILERMLIEEANKIKMMAKGSVITDDYIKYCIENAIINNDTIEVECNSTLRFLINPYYEFKDGEFENKRALTYEIRNKLIGDAKVKSTHKKIYNSISDYDCSLGQLTKVKLAETSELSLRTIHNYLKNYPRLNELFVEVRELSATEKQLTRKKYNNRRVA